MKQFIDNKYLKTSLYAILVIIVSILFYRISSNTDNIIPPISTFFSGILDVLAPILYGILIAYLMNPCLDFFERNLRKILKPKKPLSYQTIRTLSIVLVFTTLFGGIFLVVRFLIPEVFNNISQLFLNLNDYSNKISEYITYLEDFINKNVDFIPWKLEINKFIEGLDPNEVVNALNLQQAFNMSSVTSFLDTLFSRTKDVASVLINLLIGFVIAFYVLSQKELFQNSALRCIYGLFKPKMASKIISTSKEVHELFIRFFVGKTIDSFIIGCLCFIGLSLLGNKYALLLSLIVGITNMIPYFGPCIGAIPAIAISLFDGLPAVITIGLFILALQQFDGLVLGPKILGDSIGISPFWIITGITIGGALWGPLGMFFGSPLIAALLSIINRWLDRKLLRKSVSIPKLTLAEVFCSPPNTDFLSPKKTETTSPPSTTTSLEQPASLEKNQIEKDKSPEITR